MKYKEINYDLFEVNEKYIKNEDFDTEPYQLAHCISADFGMFGGIAIEFNRLWDMKTKLVTEFKNSFDKFRNKGGHAIPMTVETSDGTEFTVYNLITKEYVMNRPSYTDITLALESMKFEMCKRGQTKVAMPMIGCGIDRKDWDVVSELIQSVFENTNIEILICRLD